MADTNPVVSLDNVVVEYGRNRALNGVTASFGGGAVGLLGPNGAGKSTMIKALLGFVVPAQGQMKVLGMDVATSPVEIRARIGYMPETDGHIPGLTAVQFVAYCGELAGLPPADATPPKPANGRVVKLDTTAKRAWPAYGDNHAKSASDEHMVTVKQTTK